jgi:adenine-specific DNA-methyltransferase
VQLPEVLLESNREQKAAYSFCMKNNLQPTISELTKERLRRAGKKVREDNPDWNGDVGFRVLNSIHLISVRGKPQQKPFQNRLMPM